MQTTLPLTRDLVLIGGGHAHALVLRQWGMKPLPGVRLTVINPHPTAPYTGMLPGHIAGHYTRDELEIDLVKLARFAGARLVMGWATGIDRQAKRIAIQDHPDVAYDVTSIDVGISSAMPEIPGFTEFGIAAKPLGGYAQAWEGYLAGLNLNDTPQAAIIGGGIAGVELALAMAHRLRGLGHEPQLALIDRSGALEGVGGAARAVLFERLRAADVRVIENAEVATLTAKGLTLADGREIASTFSVGAAGARPHAWLADLGLAHEGGYLSVDRYLRSVSDPSIYAAGDCAHMVDSPRPKAGVFAVRQAPILHHNFRADLAGHSRKEFEPQKAYLKLVSLGGQEALADKWGMAWQGGWVWQMKDRIDRAFMDKLGKLPEMSAAPAPRIKAKGQPAADAMLCGGCGAKVGAQTLKGALADLAAPERDDVLSLPGDDAAVLAMEADYQVMTTDHLRAFTLDPVVMTRIAAVHALGDIWAMGATPQAAMATIILPQMSEAMQATTLAEITTTAQAVMAQAGADLVGGHTSLGAELTVGFSITGLSEDYPIGLDGAEPGAALILTKPIGSGTLLAADMRGLAKGPDLQAAFAQMAQPQGTASALLVAAGVQAMTDVTGFGLAGHLWNICTASDLAATLWLDAVPVMAGAEALSAAGVRSSLYEANRAALTALDLPETAGGRADLLCDPQTAGGLLAAVPEARVAQLLEALQKAGYAAVQIGTLQAGTPGITVQASAEQPS